MISRPSALRDFTVDRRVWLLTGVALVIGTGAAALAVILLRLIALATNIFYYHRLSLAMVGPAGSPLSPWLMMLTPVVGGLLVGLMAFYGSDKIRGHGIPEAASGHGRTCRIAPFAMAHDADSGRWWPSGWAHGLLRVGQDPRPRNS